MDIASHGTDLASDVSDEEERRLLQLSSSENLVFVEGPTISETGVNENERHLCLLLNLKKEEGEIHRG